MGNESQEGADRTGTDQVDPVEHAEDMIGISGPVDDDQPPNDLDALGDGYLDPEEETPKEKAPDTEVPDEQLGEKDSKSEVDTGKEKTEEGTEKTDEEVAAEAEAELEREALAIENDLAGIEESEPASDPAWMQRSQEKDRHINELLQTQREKDANIAEALNKAGVKMINTRTGIAFAPTDDAPNLAETTLNIDQLWRDCTDDEQNAFGEGVEAKKAFSIAMEKCGKEFASLVPPATASANDAVLSKQQSDDIYLDFTGEKLRDGKTPRYSDIGETGVMRENFVKALNANDPVMQHMNEVGWKDEVVHRAMLELAYLRTFRARHASLSYVAEMKRNSEAKTAELEKKATTRSGGGGNLNAQGPSKGSGAKSASSAVEDFVFGASDDSEDLSPKFE